MTIDILTPYNVFQDERIIINNYTSIFGNFDVFFYLRNSKYINIEGKRRSMQ